MPVLSRAIATTISATATTPPNPHCRQFELTKLLQRVERMLAWMGYHHSPTIDEPAHLVAGLSHWKFDLHRVNPPLVRLLASLPMLVVDPKTDWSDNDLMEVAVGGAVVKRLDCRAVDQIPILIEFQREAWQKRIDSPFSQHGRINVRNRLKYAIHAPKPRSSSLNDSLLRRRNRPRHSLGFRQEAPGDGRPRRNDRFGSLTDPQPLSIDAR